jgi:hypothetical protein
MALTKNDSHRSSQKYHLYLLLNQINVKKAYQFKHSVKDDQIIRQKLQISNLLLVEKVFLVTWNSALIDAK